MKRTDDEVVELGNYCADLMLQDRWNDLYEEFARDNVDLMLGTAPQEFKKREGIYAEMNGFRAFQALMLGYVTRRDQIISRAEQPSIADDSDDE